MENYRLPADNENVKKLVLSLICLFSLFAVPAYGWRILYAEQYYKLFHDHFYRYPDDTMENISYLEEALKADFCNPLYALARITNKQEWEQYRYLFKMHVNLLLIQQYLILGSKYNKQVAYFYNAPWKEANLKSLELAERPFRVALDYWTETLKWAARIPRLRFHLEQIQHWEDEWFRIVTKDLNYHEIISVHLARIEKVRRDFQNMDENTY
ncbi:MAG: hypothetical protein JW969_16530 [Spirochaetales bacterium]|nr:hypothetical protein [Spirochaetales bacterium]